MNAISEAASKRGPSGSQKIAHIHDVIAILKDGTVEPTLSTTNRRDARRRYDMIVKYSQDASGKYSGASVRLTCDGEMVAEYKAA